MVEVETGKIRAMAEYPSVDPNDVDALRHDDRYSHIFQRHVRARLDVQGDHRRDRDRRRRPDPDLHCRRVRLGELRQRRERDRRVLAPGPTLYTLAGVLIDSSNAGISKFSERVSPQIRYDYLKKFGIGTGSAVGLRRRAHGLLYSRRSGTTRRCTTRRSVRALTTTVPELLGAYEAIANDGVKMPLSLVESCTKR